MSVAYTYIYFAARVQSIAATAAHPDAVQPLSKSSRGRKLRAKLSWLILTYP